MNKFLNIVEQNMPTTVPTNPGWVKLAEVLAETLRRAGIAAEPSSDTPEIEISLKGKTIVLNIAKVIGGAAEDAEDPEDETSAISAIVNSTERAPGKQGPAGEKFQQAKNKMASAASKIADKFTRAAQ